MMPLRPPGFSFNERQPPPSADRRDGPFDLNKAFEVARGIIKREAIDPSKLGKPYSDRDIYADMQHARNKETEFERNSSTHEKESRRLAKILEVAIHEQVQAGWFGSDAHTLIPSWYDDVINKTDLITEFDLREAGVTTHAAMGIDVTYAQELKSKFHRIKEEIDEGVLGTVKYYKSRDGRFTGSLNKVPRVVIGMDEEAAMVVARAWYGNNPALKTDRLRDQVLIQAIDQCEAFAEYADTQKKPEIAAEYRRTKELFQKAYGQPVTPEKRRQFSNDKVFRALELLLLELKGLK